MKPRFALLAAVLLCAATAAIAASAPPRLGKNNFVEVGDTLVDMINTSGLAFSTLVIGQATGAVLQRAAFAPPRALPITHPFESPCPGGGSVSGSMRDTDASGDLSVQDRFVTVFNACRLEGGEVTGSSEFSVAAHHVDSLVEVTELDFVFRQLGTESLRWSGPARVTLRSDRRNGSEQIVVRYQDLSVERAGRRYRWNFTLDVQRPPIGDDTTSIDGAMTMLGMTLRLNQDEPFLIGAEGVPRAGRLTATDLSGTRVAVDAERLHYIYRLYLHGNRTGVPDAEAGESSRAR